MWRWRAFTVAVVLAVVDRPAGAVNIWLSETGTVTPGSSLPATSSALPIAEPFLGGSGTIYIWGRPDAGKSLANLSLNLVAETQPICSPSCVTPNAIEFTSVTLYNDLFGAPIRMRFEYVDDSTSTPPLPIDPNLIEGLEGLRIFDGGSIPAVGIGSLIDPRYDSLHNSWLIAEVTYDVLATEVNTETYLFLEIGPVGMNHTGESTAAHSVVFGHASDVALTDTVVLVGGVPTHVNRGVHPGIYDALIRPRPLLGDADGNGVVNGADYTIWKMNFGSTSMLAADHNKNGVVDAADYVLWRDNLGLMIGAGTVVAIPEPSIALLSLIALSALLTACRPTTGRANS